MPQATIYYHGTHPDYELHELSVLEAAAVERLPESWSTLHERHVEEPYLRIDPGRPPFSAQLYPQRARVDVAGEGIAEFLDGEGLQFWSFIRERYPENRPRDWGNANELRSLFEYDPDAVGTQISHPEYLEL